MSEPPLRPDAPFYTDEELDAMYERDPVRALRTSREQLLLRRRLEAEKRTAAGAPPPTPEGVKEAMEEARRILLKDGGDIEFVSLSGSVVEVRLKGNCVGCPRAVLDLRHVVEQLLKNRFPSITEVRNIF